MSPHLRHTLVVMAIAFISTHAWAQQRFPISFSGEGAKSRWVQQHIIDVDDVTGHQIRIYELQRIYPSENGIVLDGERVIEEWSRGSSNYTNGIGPVSGFTTWTTEKGNKVFMESAGSSETVATETGSKRGTYHGTTRIVGGTGRFAKLRGLLAGESEFDTDPKLNYNIYSIHGEYWFEK